MLVESFQSSEMTSNANAKLVCPVKDRSVGRYRQGERQHVFQHIRSYHDISEVPGEFLLKHSLQPCKFCRKPFVTRNPSNGANFLERHMKRCPARATPRESDIANTQDDISMSVPPSIYEPLSGHSKEAASSNGHANSSRDHGVGWSFINQLELDCLSRCIVPTVKQLQSFLQASFRECCTIPLQLIAEDSSNEAAWKLFLLIPRLLLQPVDRGGQSGRKEIEKRYVMFMEERWHELYLSSKSSSPLPSGEVEELQSDPLPAKLIQSVRSKIKDGEISRAANLLTSAGVAPSSVATLEQLRKKHPPRQDTVEDYQEIVTPV